MCCNVHVVCTNSKFDTWYCVALLQLALTCIAWWPLNTARHHRGGCQDHSTLAVLHCQPVLHRSIALEYQSPPDPSSVEENLKRKKFLYLLKCLFIFGQYPVMLLALCLGITSGSALGLYGMLGFDLRLTRYKANILPALLLLGPQNIP